MKKNILLLLILAVSLFCFFFGVISVGAADTVVYLANDGNGDGSTADAPLGTLTDAYNAIGDNDGVIVICSPFSITARLAAPSHAGTIKYTSVYDGVDYRVTNNANIIFGNFTLTLGGATVMENLTFTIATTSVIAANFHSLTMGDGLTMNAAGQGMYLAGGNNGTTTNVNMLMSPDTAEINIKSGTYYSIVSFTRAIAGKTHTGTMHVNVSGDTDITTLLLGATGGSGSTLAHGGSTILTLKDNVSVATLGLAGAGYMNGSVIVNAYDAAEIGAFSYYGAVYFPSGTKTLYHSQTATLPANISTVFTTVKQEGSVEIILPENVTVAGIDSVLIGGIADETATITETNEGAIVDFFTSENEFILSLAASDGNVYAYTVTFTDGAYTAVLIEEGDVVDGVVFLSDSGSSLGSGTSAAKAVDTLTAAYNLLGEDGGIIVVCGEYSMGSSAISLPAHTGAVTITSVYDGIDYRSIPSNPAKLVYTTSVNFLLSGETVFENITFSIETTGVVSACYNKVTFGEGCEMNIISTAESSGLYVIGGYNKGATTTYTEDTDITLQSGTFKTVVAFSRYSGASVHTGNATLKIGGNAIVKSLFFGSVNAGADGNNTTLYLEDDAIIHSLYLGGDASSCLLKGDATIFALGGDVYSMFNYSLVLGDKILIYDPQTAPAGIVEFAELSFFDTITATCEYNNSHSYSAPFSTAYDSTVTYQKCAYCGKIEQLSGTLPEQYAAGAVFVADDGIGDGRSPLYPTSSYEDAFKEVADGGTVVIMDEVTVSRNFLDKMSRTVAYFNEPLHAGKILVTSFYDGVDYRLTNNAKLIFDTNLHYHMYGETEFDNIIFDAAEGSTTTAIAARYNSVTFGDDCTMLKTNADNYKLYLMGGYEYFKYVDLIGYASDNEYLQITNDAFPVKNADTFTLPDRANIGGTNHFLRAEAAEAYDRMIAALVNDGLTAPTITDSTRTYARQYYLYMSSIVKWRRDYGYDYDKSHKNTIMSCSVPGWSEHEIGLAVDNFDTTLDYSNPHAHFDETAEWAWLMEHAKEYGFILRFLSDKTAQTGFIYEAWHFRYVGVEHAYAITNAGYSLEEYVADLLGLYERDSDIIIKSGTYHLITGSSRYTNSLDFGGSSNVTISGPTTVTSGVYGGTINATSSNVESANISILSGNIANVYMAYGDGATSNVANAALDISCVANVANIQTSGVTGDFSSRVGHDFKITITIDGNEKTTEKTCLVCGETTKTTETLQSNEASEYGGSGIRYATENSRTGIRSRFSVNSEKINEYEAAGYTVEYGVIATAGFDPSLTVTGNRVKPVSSHAVMRTVYTTDRGRLVSYTETDELTHVFTAVIVGIPMQNEYLTHTYLLNLFMIIRDADGNIVFCDINTADEATEYGSTTLGADGIFYYNDIPLCKADGMKREYNGVTYYGRSFKYMAAMLLEKSSPSAVETAFLHNLLGTN